MYAFGLLALAGTAALTARLVWEQTVLSWERGPQMMGFALVHNAGAVLFLFPTVLTAWLVAVALIGVWHVTRKRRISWMTATVAAFAVLLLVILAPPSEFWQRLFVDRVASSPYAADFLVNSAPVNDLYTVVALVSHGVHPGR